MSWLSSFLHPGRAYKKAGEVEERNFKQSQQIRHPYIQHGEDAYTGYNDMYQKLMHPEQLQSDWANSYEKSPYATNLQQEAMGQGMDAASASGLNGSSAAIANIQKGSTDIMQKDRQQYMNDMMQKYLSAMGIGSNLYGTGASMAANSANAQQQHGENQAQMTYGQNAAGGNSFMQFMPYIAAMFGGGDISKMLNMPGMGTTSQMYGGA